jgi:spore coat polysaccharide biosynthesis protein SpsF
VAVFRGSPENVAGRALACAEHHGFERFARLCGDSPFFDPEIVDRLVARHVSEGLDIATNVFPRTFPTGASVEVVATAALRRALAAMTDAAEREHMTQYFYRHPEEFSISNLAAADGRYAAIALAVDTPDDLARSRWMVAQLGERASTAGLDDLASLAPAWAEVAARAAGRAR